MTPLRILFVCGAFLCACATLPRAAELPPLEHEGEVHLQLLPLSADAARLSFEVGALSAVRADGAQVPLELLAEAISTKSGAAAIALGRGRLEPGGYSGFQLSVRKAALAGPDGDAALLVPQEPVRIDAPFTISARQATLISLELRYSKALASGFSFEPAFVASQEPRPVPQRLGLIASPDHTLTVFDKHAYRVSAPWPTGAGPWGVALDVIGNRAYVALTAQDELQVFDLTSGAELTRHRLGAGDAPRELALTPDRRLLVCINHGSSTVSLFDPGSMFEVGRIPVAESPTSLLLDRTGTRAYVTGARNALSVVDLATRTVVGTLRTPDRPLRPQLDRAGRRLYVAQESSAYLTVFSLPSLAQERTAYLGLGTTFLKVDPNTDLLYVANRDSRRLEVYDPAALLVIDALPVAGAVGWMAISDAENALFILQPEARRVSVVDLTTRQPLAEFPVDRGARTLTLAGERE